MSESKYKVIQTANSLDLERKLNKARTEGWELHSFQATAASDKNS